MEKQIDAVFVATPDHQHANPSLRAIKSGKHVYTEKCLTHDISEARILGDAARRAKVVTQMGNQGSGTGNHQVLAEYLQAGAIGKLKEVHSWCGWRPMRFGCRMDYPEGDLAEMPETHWSEWLGQAKERFYSDYFRCEWYGWFDFATGSLGGWGTHILDAVFFALNLKYPTAMELVETSQLSEDRFPRHATIRFDFPPRGGVQPPPVFWYDGSVPNPKNPHRGIPHYPPLYHEIRKKYGEAGKALRQCGQHLRRRRGDDLLLFPRRPAAIVPLGVAAGLQAADSDAAAAVWRHIPRFLPRLQRRRPPGLLELRRFLRPFHRRAVGRSPGRACRVARAG